MNTGFQINREYLDTKFQGYKLNTAPLPLHTHHISEGLYIVHPSDDQYSFLQQREYSLYNHLHSDPWDPFSVYVVTSEKKIKRIAVDKKVYGGFSGMHVVWDIPFSKEKTRGYANVSLCFASPEIVVVSDGAGSLHILATGDRKQTTGFWKELFSEKVQDGIRLADALCVSSKQLHCLCPHVDAKNSYILYLHLTCDEHNKWKLESTITFSGKGSIDYVSLGSDCQNAYVIGQIEAKTQEFMGELNNKLIDSPEDTSFEWQQNFEEIKLWINISDGSKPIVSTTFTEVQIKAPDERILLHGILYRPIEPEMTTWQLIKREDGSKFEVVLSKRDEGSMWPQVFGTSEFQGREIPDAQLAADIHNKLAHLTSETEDVGGATVLNSGQLEECDISDGEGRLLLQYDLLSSLTTPNNKVDLGNGQWLMCSSRKENNAARFCLRSDVDGIVWEIKDKTLKHVATLCAYGFVQASKSSRVFSFLPYDASYCGLVDADGRVFIYREGVRPNNKEEWGSQQIVNLGKAKIQGVHATSSHVFILSEKDLFIVSLFSSTSE